jgi:hypothetical protein
MASATESDTQIDNNEMVVWMDGKSRAQIYSTWSPSLWRYISDDHDLANNDDDGFDYIGILNGGSGLGG